VLSLNERGTSKVVDAHAPLSTLFGDVPGLRGLSRGRANATMHFAHYAAAPPAIAQQMAK
jgi:elongation factor G